MPDAQVKFSIVIVTKDASDIIVRLLQSIQGLTDDIIVCDSGSKDNTPALAAEMGAIVHHIPWEGFGKSKNVANGFAKYDWILSMDSDEKVDAELYQALKGWVPGGDNIIYQVRWKNFIGSYWIRLTGGWKNRLFNKNIAQWDDAIAHEDIFSKYPIKRIQIPGFVEHYSHRDLKHHFYKNWESAMLTAERNHSAGKKSSILKIIVNPLVAFIRTYFFKLGFLNGSIGFIYSCSTGYYVFLKYARLLELNEVSDRKSTLH